MLAGPVWTGLRAIGLPAAASGALGALVLAGGAWWIAPRLPGAFDGIARQRPVATIVIALLWLFGAGNIVRVSAYMADVNRTNGVIMPGDAFYEHHNCFTAYMRAAELARDRVSNVYEPTHYWGDHENDPRDHIGPLSVDLYEYPPAFLLPVRLGIAVGADFFTLRALWFMLEALLVASALVGVALWIGGREGLVVGILAGVVFASPTSIGTLQMGNFQLAAYALALLAMVAFARHRPLLGGALLGYATISKLFPGLLLVPLLARKNWRAVGSTVGWAGALTVLALALFGWAPVEAFLKYQLPRMADGSAFPFLREFPPANANNHSVFGIVLKLAFWHVPGMTVGVGAWLAWAYTAAIVVFAYVRGGRVTDDRLCEATWWLVLLQFAALRSPFTPDLYAQFVPVWLITMLAVRSSPPGRVCYGLAWVVFAASILWLSVVSPLSIGKYFGFLAGVQFLGFAILALAVRATSKVPEQVLMQASS